MDFIECRDLIQLNPKNSVFLLKKGWGEGGGLNMKYGIKIYFYDIFSFEKFFKKAFI